MNHSETTYTQIKFELRERERRISRLMGRESATRPITPRGGWVGKLETWLRSAPGNRTESLSPRLETERGLPLVSLKDHEAAS
jgi:hypothetical protein